MKTEEIIQLVQGDIIEYHLDEVSGIDVLRTRDYLEEHSLSNFKKLNDFEGIIHQHVHQNIQWYLDTEEIAYLDSARELLFSLIEQYLEEGIL